MRQILTPSLLALLLTACSAPETSMTQTPSPATEAAAEADVEAGGRGLVKLNPSPRKAFEVTLTLDKAPGAFGLVRGAAQYDVVNEQECGKIQHETGTAGRITSQEDFVLKKISDTEYRGTVYLDLMQDEDYYGRGVCHWEFSGASVLLKATGAEAETRFLSFIEAATVTGQQASTKYYWRERYPRSEMSDFPDMGKRDVEEFKPEIRDNLFTITLAAKEAAP
ncbi:putative secreted protein [Xanthomonas fragariae]|nr:putative secreted protein [Xanthomonas fragariae]